MLAVWHSFIPPIVFLLSVSGMSCSFHFAIVSESYTYTFLPKLPPPPKKTTTTIQQKVEDHKRSPIALLSKRRKCLASGKLHLRISGCDILCVVNTRECGEKESDEGNEGGN